MKRPIPGIQIEDQPEPIICIMGLYGEARGEPNAGKLAVLCVAANRAEKSGSSIADVFLKHSDKNTYQFTSFDPRDPNRDKLLVGWKEDPASWAACEAVYDLHDAGLTSDPTHGADHYYNPSIAKPAWGAGSKDWQDRGMIGNHRYGVCP